MILTGIPTSYWHEAPMAEVRTALAVLAERNGNPAHAGQEVVISGGR